MKRLISVLMVMVLLVFTTSMVFAGVDWDGDPVLSVNGTTVYVDYGFRDGDFILEGGQIRLIAEAPQISLLDPGPSYIKTMVEVDGKKGHLLLTTTLSGEDAPKTFKVRVRVPSKGVEKIFTAKSGSTIDFEMLK